MALIILDRDGVINQDSGAHIKSPDEWTPIPGSLEAITRLHHAGHRIAVATNQSGVGRRLFNIETLGRIHEKMYVSLAEMGGTIDAVFFCPHTPRDRCRCRKPKPGMLEEIGGRLRTALDNVPVIGDKWSDVEAARAVGARPMLVRTGLEPFTGESAGRLHEVEVYDDLAAAVDDLLAGALDRAAG